MKYAWLARCLVSLMLTSQAASNETAPPVVRGLDDACVVDSGTLILDVTAVCQQFLNHTAFTNVSLVNAAQACNVAHITPHGIYLRIDQSRYKECGFTITADGALDGSRQMQTFLTCTESTVKVVCTLNDRNKLSSRNITDSWADSNTFPPEKLKKQKKRQLPPRKTFPIDFLEVPVSPKRIKDINATTPDPIVIMSLSSYDRDVRFGDSVDIGSLLRMQLKLDANTSGIYGLRLQNLDATGGEMGQYGEPLVRDGCPTETAVAPNISPVDRSTIEVAFRAFRFPAASSVKFIATVRVCIQRCQRIHCGTRSKNQRVSRAIAAWNTTALPARHFEPSTKVLRKNKEYEIVTIAAVDVRGYDRKYVVGLHGASARAGAGRLVPAAASIIITLTTGLVYRSLTSSRHLMSVF